MKSRISAASLLALAWALPVTAQEDLVFKVDGTKLADVRVVSFDVRNLRYTKGGNTDTLASDQVAKVDLAKFKEVYRRGLKDPDLMLTVARDQLQANNALMAQMGLVGASAQFFDSDQAPKAVAALDELQKSIPEAGVLPEVFRQKFEYYIGLGAKGAPSAMTVAKKYQAEAIGGAWPAGFSTEAEFFLAMAERASGGNPKDYQGKLRAVIGKAGGNSPMIANRANVQLAHSLRETKDVDGARRIYEDLAKRDNVDTSSRAGAFLGLGHLLLDEGTSENKDLFKQALLMFLRVRLETRDAWPSLQAEALYHAVLAADKWRGPEYQYIMSGCRRSLFADFPGSEWTQRAKAGR